MNKKSPEAMTIWERPIRTYIETALKHISPEDSCALFLICFDAGDMPDGTCPAAEAIEEQGRFLSALFRATDIIGRNDTGEWVVFICGSLTEAAVTQKAEMIREKAAEQGWRAFVGVGAAVGNTTGQQELYEKGKQALLRAKTSEACPVHRRDRGT